ncbi:MAG: hypothetical protein R6X18_14445 [Chloroflexota bacterium]|jgi:hypothetical protein
MSDENPLVDDLKAEERMKIEIPVEEDPMGSGKAHGGDVVEEFKRLGQQFVDTLESIFSSDEVKRLETEVRAGVKSFADEVDKAFQQAKESPAATRMKEEASTVKDRVESGDVARQAQEGMVSGLRWLSNELDKLAGQFEHSADTEPVEKSPPAE